MQLVAKFQYQRLGVAPFPFFLVFAFHESNLLSLRKDSKEEENLQGQGLSSARLLIPSRVGIISIQRATGVNSWVRNRGKTVHHQLEEGTKDQFEKEESNIGERRC